MHRNRTWTLDPPEWRTQRNRLLPIEGGDGSTLNLDFTKGVLDPRLIFSRLGTATFVNSSGYVDYAGANLIVYSNAFTSGTSWYLGGTQATLTPNYAVGPDGITGSAWRFQGASSNSVFAQQISNNGVAHVVSIYAKSNTASNQTFTIYNGVSGTTCTATSVWQRFEVPAAGTWGYAYFGTLGASQDILIWGAQSNLGSTAQPYYPTTTAAYHAPRFDYSPTNIGEPRGLLIEGQAQNLALNSSTMSSSTYTVQEATLSTGSANDPSNSVNAPKLTPNIGFTYSSHLIYSTVGVSNSTAYTLSVYAKANGYNRIGVCIAASNRYTAVFDLTDGTFVQSSSVGSPTGTGYAITPIGTNGWYRCSVTMTTADTTLYPHVMVVNDGTITFNAVAQATFVGDTSKSIYLWGAQLEKGSGASSYIPTGASQVTRNADFLLSASSSGAGRNTEFSLDDLAPGTSALNEHTVLWTYKRDPNSKREYPATLYARTNANTKRIDIRDFSGTTVEAGTETRTIQSATVGTASKVKVALSQNTSAYPISAINGTSATFTSGIIDSALGLQWVQLCNTSVIAGAWNPIWAQQLKVYPTALTAAQLQTLTTP